MLRVTMMRMYAVIVANAPAFMIEPFYGLLSHADLLIAADGGGNSLYRAGLTPDLLVGDLDSLKPQALHAFRQAGVVIRQYPPAKDETDLELALLQAVAANATRIDILGALGGRFDQSLANVALLALPELASCRVRLLDAEQEVYLAHRSVVINGAIGDVVSLLPVGGPARGITTRGLEYSLYEAELYFEHSRGISNTIITTPAHVSVREGLLLVVHRFTR